MTLTTQELRIEARAVEPRTWQIYINGEYCDTCYGTYIDAHNHVEIWRQAIAEDHMILDRLDIPFFELPDSYFKNGHVPPLTLDKPIPFQGEPWPPNDDEFEPEGEELPV